MRLLNVIKINIESIFKKHGKLWQHSAHNYNVKVNRMFEEFVVLG